MDALLVAVVVVVLAVAWIPGFTTVLLLKIIDRQSQQLTRLSVLASDRRPSEQAHLLRSAGAVQAPADVRLPPHVAEALAVASGQTPLNPQGDGNVVGM